MKKGTLTDEQVLELLRDKFYVVDPNDGSIVGSKGEILTQKICGRDEKRPAVRLHRNGSQRQIAVSKLVWMSVTLRVVPKGFEIHHWDENVWNNRWVNLFCLFEMDHAKLHGKTLLSGDVPF